MAARSTQEILDRKVLTQDGREVGQVEGLDIDLRTWSVKTIEIRLRRDALEALHVKKPLFGTRTVRVAVEHVSGVKDSVVLKTGLEELSEVLENVGHEEGS